MKETGRLKAGVISYKGFPVSPSNCNDVNIIYKDSYLPSDLFSERNLTRNNVNLQLDQQYTSSCRQMLSAMGQFVRWGIVKKVISIRGGWQQGAVFNAMQNELLVQTFIEYFRVRGAAGTVNCKTIHLRTAIRSALNHSGGDIKKREELNNVYLYLQKCGNASKRLTRSKSTIRRIVRVREEEGKMLFPEDFEKLISKARKTLNGIMDSAGRSGGSSNCPSPSDMFQNNSDLLRKWCINMIALSMLLAGGQRPQVFTTVQCPTDTQMSLWSSSSFRGSYIELETKDEKRVRTTDLPNIIIPKLLLYYLRFHLKYVRPVIMKTTGVLPEPEQNRPLFIHTETGECLDSDQVTHVLKCFVKHVDPELHGITSLSLRASFATMMFRSHRAGDVFQNLNEERFLEELGKLMNTSVEQLRQTYIQSDSVDFSTTADEVAVYLGQFGNKDYDDSDEESTGRRRRQIPRLLAGEDE